jgi:hypothetical protein
MRSWKKYYIQVDGWMCYIMTRSGEEKKNENKIGDNGKSQVKKKSIN